MKTDNFQMASDINDIRAILIESADSGYRDFSSALIPGETKILGVRIPVMRKIAKGIVKGYWKKFLASNRLFYFEERMLQGFVIGYAPCVIEEKLDYTRGFIPLITNWSLCDFFFWKLKSSEKETVWNFIQPYFHSDKEFEVRFAAVAGLESFIDNEHIDLLLENLCNTSQNDYYAKMGVAWALAECYIAFPEKTMLCLKSGSLNPEIRKMALRKINESFRVKSEDKIRLKESFSN